MKVLLLTVLLALQAQNFPELDDAELDADLIEPSEEEEADPGQPLQPNDSAEFEELNPDEVEVDDPASGSDWSTRQVRPEVVDPGANSSSSSAADDTLPPPILSPGAESDDDELKPPVPDLSGPGDEVPFIAGYKDFLWMDSLNTVRRSFDSDNPLVEQSGNRYLVQNTCEGEEAAIILAFDAKNELTGVTCRFVKGVVDYKPDYEMYKKVRASLVRQWGAPQVTNESPAPDSPVQASQWNGKAGTATLAFDLEKNFVQLKVVQKKGN